MKRKLADDRGLTLVESLCTVVILILLGLMLNTGLNLAVKTYHDVTADSETQLLLSTAVAALSDELRYARSVQVDGDRLKSYNSTSYGDNVTITYDTGQIFVGGMRLLPAGAYRNGLYEVTQLDITYTDASSLFTIFLKVAEAGGTISAETTVTVRCLDGETAPLSGEGGDP